MYKFSIFLLLAEHLLESPIPFYILRFITNAFFFYYDVVLFLQYQRNLSKTNRVLTKREQFMKIDIRELLFF